MHDMSSWINLWNYVFAIRIHIIMSEQMHELRGNNSIQNCRQACLWIRKLNSGDGVVGWLSFNSRFNRIQTRGKLLQLLPYSLCWFTLLSETCNFALNRDISQPTFCQFAANQYPVLPAAKSFILKYNTIHSSREIHTVVINKHDSWFGNNYSYSLKDKTILFWQYKHHLIVLGWFFMVC